VVWIYLVLGVGVVGLGLIGWYLYVLYRKFAAVVTELAVVAERAEQALDLLARIEIPDRLGDRYDATFPRAEPDDDLHDQPDDLDALAFEARFSAGSATRRRT
jgi:hypothetical protein